MSIKHATVSAWQREEDGSYKASLYDATLHVTWRPESDSARRGFSWAVERESGAAERSPEGEVYEEIEQAMAEAEEAARGQTPAS